MISNAADHTAGPKELYWLLNAVTLEMGDILALIEANGAVDRNQLA